MTSLTSEQRGRNMNSVAQMLRSLSKYLKGGALPLEGMRLQQAIRAAEI